LKRLLVLLALVPIVAASASAAPPRAVRPAGINIEPGLRPWRWSGANPDGWWCRPPNCNGVRNGTFFVDRELTLAKALHAANVRVEFPWPLIEPRAGRFDWRRADYIVRAARRRHLRLQPILIYTPAWAAAHQNDPPPAQAYAAFVRALAARYRGAVSEIELWDEPDLDRYWNGDQAAYVNDVLIPGYRAVKAVAPRVRVVLAASQQPDAEWLRGIYRLGGGSSFDIASYHDYSGDRRVLANATIIRDVLREHGQLQKPVWLGEFGLQEPGLADARQRALIEAVLTERAPIAMAQWYALRDDYNMTCCPPAAVLFEPFGLVNHAYRRKAAFAAMQALLRR
jgi:hypothetical protein